MGVLRGDRRSARGLGRVLEEEELMLKNMRFDVHKELTPAELGHVNMLVMSWRRLSARLTQGATWSSAATTSAAYARI